MQHPHELTETIGVFFQGGGFGDQNQISLEDVKTASLILTI